MASKEKIISRVCEIYGVLEDEIFKKNRTAEMTKPRFIICALLHREGMSYHSIGDLLNRDHTTALNAACEAEKRWPQEVNDLAGQDWEESAGIFSQRELNAKKLGISLNNYLKTTV